MALPDLKQVADLYYGDLYRFAWSLAGHTPDAEDLVQQCLLRYAQKGNSIREPDKVKSWLFAVLHREFLQSRKKTSRFSTVELNTVIELSDSGYQAPENIPALDHEAVLGALERMDESLRSPLTLFYLRDLKYREIAEILGVPIGTVMSRLARAKASLREALGIVLEKDFPLAKTI